MAQALGFAALVASCAARSGTGDDWTDAGAVHGAPEVGVSDAGGRAPCPDDAACPAAHDCGPGAACDAVDDPCRCGEDEDGHEVELGDGDFGCREGDCGPGQTCDPLTRVCKCTGDEGCDEDAFCDVMVGACIAGCRIEPDTCPDRWTCDPANHFCVAPTVCCAGVDGSRCTLTLAAACGGRSIEGLFECDPNPCARSCFGDGDCAPGTHCSAEHLCAEGCRTGTPGDCGEGRVCESSTHTCTPAAASCATDEECVDLRTFCNVSTGGCVPGCRLDPRWNSCGPDLTCMEDHVCAICDRICGEYVVSCNEPCP